MFGLETDLLILLIVCLICALAFEFINGFHDTANAVATVIYTNSLKPVPAVIWSGLMNALGVILGGVGVAYGIVKLLPVDTIVDQSINMNVALILSLLLSAIIWNIGTWYLGIPCSSSHTLIGSILGVGIAMSINSPEGFGHGVNWKKAMEIGLSLLFSPLLGFALTIFLMFLLKTLVKNPKLYSEPDRKKHPPFWIRLILIGTCTGVSFSHGNNDGQKGIGLVMIILIAFAPAVFLLNSNLKSDDLHKHVNRVNTVIVSVDTASLAIDEKGVYLKALEDVNALMLVTPTTPGADIPGDSKKSIRASLISLNKNLDKMNKSASFGFSGEQKITLKKEIKSLKRFYEYAPLWVVIAISIALGVGTMIGWKRIVRTIGEKIGKEHLSYSQGMTAELVAASTIFFASTLKLPVSTTHVLSSGIAGSMVASKGVKNLQGKTIKTIAIAWLLTLPTTILLAGSMYLLFAAIF